MLRQEAGKSRKQKRTAKQMHADLVALGYDGSYGRVAAFVREWRADRQREQQTTGRGTFVPLGSWPARRSSSTGARTGRSSRASAPSCRWRTPSSPHSRAFLLGAYLQQTHEMLFDAHASAFRVLGGVPRRGIYDNMRTAVDAVGRARSAGQRPLRGHGGHYLFEPEFCNRAAGWEKGHVEKNVQDRAPADLAAAIAAALPRLGGAQHLAAERCRAAWQILRHPQWPERTVADGPGR